MLAKIISSLAIVSALCLNVHTSFETKQLQLMAHLYPFYESHVLKSLPSFGIYTTSLDTSLIERYAKRITQALIKDDLAESDKEAIKKIAYFMTRGAIYRNGTANSRWRIYAKQSIVQALQTNDVGVEILDSLSAEDPQLQAEIEAYNTNVK